MDSSEEEDLALLEFALFMDDDGKKKKKRKHQFWIRDIYKKKEKNKEYFLISYVSYDLMIESIFSSKFYFLV